MHLSFSGEDLDICLLYLSARLAAAYDALLLQQQTLLRCLPDVSGSGEYPFGMLLDCGCLSQLRKEACTTDAPRVQSLRAEPHQGVLERSMDCRSLRSQLYWAEPVV